MSQSSTSIPTPIPTIGILGDGQLAAMMARAYRGLGGKVAVYGESATSPAGTHASRFVEGSAGDNEKLLAFMRSVDIVTLENEFYPSQQLIDLSEQSGTPIYPEPRRYQFIEDKLSEKKYFDGLGVAVAPYAEITNSNQLKEEPGYLKLAKGGYDGIGTYFVATRREAIAVFERIKNSGQVLFEQQINYQKELSLVAASGVGGNVYYPLVTTHQEEGTCRYVSYPAEVSHDIEQQAQAMVAAILDGLGTRGLFAFELFLTQDNRLILNESAPRPHNSGHITLDLHTVSQFDTHMRAVAGLPLAQPQARFKAALMVNLLASRAGEFAAADVTKELTRENQTVELYGKAMSRPKRKMGHVNLWGDNLWQRAKHIVENLDI